KSRRVSHASPGSPLSHVDNWAAISRSETSASSGSVMISERNSTMSATRLITSPASAAFCRFVSAISGSDQVRGALVLGGRRAQDLDVADVVGQAAHQVAADDRETGQCRGDALRGGQGLDALAELTRVFADR